MKPLVVSVPDAKFVQALGRIEGVEVIEWSMEHPSTRAEIDLVVVPQLKGRSAVTRLAGVKTQAVQLLSLGFDGIESALPPGHRVSNGVGLHEASTAELAVALTLASLRGIPSFVRAEGQWKKAERLSLADRTVLLLGVGGIGQAIEARLRPFEVEITRVASRARDGVHGVDELPALLPLADVVIVAVPLNEKTRGMIDGPFFAAMKNGALFVNVARGGLVEQRSLEAEAQSGRLGFALDVVDPEPLPPSNLLWTLPNVLITPHVGGMTTAMFPRAVKLIRSQIERLQSGAAPLYVVIG